MSKRQNIPSESISDKERIALLEQLLAQSNAQLESVERGYIATIESMKADFQAQQEKAELTYKAELEALKSELQRLTDIIRTANARHFGAKSEKVMPYQISLFNDMEAAFDKACEEPELDLEHTSKPKRKKPRKIDTSSMPVVVFEHVIDEKDRICEECGTPMQDIRIEVRRVIKLIPAHFEVEEHRRHVYVCPECSALNAQGDDVKTVFKRAEAPALPIEKSWAHPSLIAGVINSKYVNAMPLCRIQQDLKSIDQNMEVSRQCMAGWVIAVHKRWLSLIHARMKEKILEDNLIHMDETGIQVLKEPNRLPSAKSWMWVMTSPEDSIPIHIFEYRTTRAKTVPQELLCGWTGTLMSDCYASYFSLTGVTNLACLVHIRREFINVIKDIPQDKLNKIESYAADGVAMINRMFAIDHKFSDMKPQTRKEMRDKHLRPVMEQFGEWLYANVDKVAPRHKLHNAFTNAIKHWPHVMNVLKDGRFPLSNNLAERVIRPFVIGRVNWLFSDTQNGAHASAAIYSIVSTARANGLVPGRYIEWLLTEMPNTTNLQDPSVLEGFMPWSDAIPKWVQASPGAPRIAPDDPIVDVDTHIMDAIKVLETS